jgi:hypothetical protein
MMRLVDDRLHGEIGARHLRRGGGKLLAETLNVLER